MPSDDEYERGKPSVHVPSVCMLVLQRVLFPVVSLVPSVEPPSVGTASPCPEEAVELADVALDGPTVIVVKISVVADSRVKVTFEKMTRVKFIAPDATLVESVTDAVLLALVVDWAVASFHSVDCDPSAVVKPGTCVRVRTMLLVSVLTTVALCVPTLVLLVQVDATPLVQPDPPAVGCNTVEFHDSGKRAELLPAAQDEPCSSPEGVVAARSDDAEGVSVIVLVINWDLPAVQCSLNVESEAVDNGGSPLDLDEVVDGVPGSPSTLVRLLPTSVLRTELSAPE